MSVIRAAHAFFFFFFNDTATTEIYTLSLHDALPISAGGGPAARTHRCAGERAAGPGGPAGEGWHLSEPAVGRAKAADRKSTRLNSSHLVISYAVFCLKKKKNKITHQPQQTPYQDRRP